MRPIKLRFWDKKRKEMNEQDLAEITEDDVWFDGKTSNWSVMYDVTHEQERFICMQYTGVIDKMHHEIYEGDILSFVNPDMRAVVRFGEYEFEGGEYIVRGIGFYLEIFHKTKLNGWQSQKFLSSHSIPSDRNEILGNIYENPNLLS